MLLMDLKNVLKAAARSGMHIALIPVVAAYRAECAVLPEARRDAVFQAYSQALSTLPGLLGQYARRAFYAAVLPQCHPRSCINWGTVFTSRELYLAEGVYVGARCMIGKARLERHVTIGSNVDVLSGKRQHAFDDPWRPVQDQGGERTLVTIGENSWIGNGAIVMADVGPRAVVAAGSVVVHPVPEGAIVAGNPARVVRMRTEAQRAQARSEAPA